MNNEYNYHSKAGAGLDLARIRAKKRNEARLCVMNVIYLELPIMHALCTNY